MNTTKDINMILKLSCKAKQHKKTNLLVNFLLIDAFHRLECFE